MNEEYSYVSELGIDDKDKENIPITDDYMFGYVMQRNQICLELLRLIFPDLSIRNVEMSENQNVEIQKTLGTVGRQRGVRYDVYLDDGKTVFIVEMQTVSKSDLPERSRFYHSAIDFHQLKKSETFKSLRPSYVIFICTFDPFGKGWWRYDYNYCCIKGKEILPLDDGAHRVFLNTTGHGSDIGDKLKEVLQYIDDPKSFPVKDTKNKVVKMLDEEVVKANKDKDFKEFYNNNMLKSLFDYRYAAHEGYEKGEIEGKAIGRAEGKAEGEAKGRAEARAEMIQQMLKEKISIEKISLCSGYSTEEIKRIANNSVQI